MRIDERLNLIIPIEYAGGTAYAHAMPLSREVFETHFFILSKTFAAIYAEGLSHIAGPRVAALLMKRIAVAAKIWDGPSGVEQSLVAEMRRLTSVILPTSAGWETVPYHEVVERGLIDADDISEVENALTFFIVASAMHQRKELPTILGGAARIWGAQISSLSITAFAASLPTSKETGSSGATDQAPSIPH